MFQRTKVSTFWDALPLPNLFFNQRTCFTLLMKRWAFQQAPDLNTLRLLTSVIRFFFLLICVLEAALFQWFKGTPRDRSSCSSSVVGKVIGVEAVCPFMIYGEIVQRWRVAGGAELQKWPSSVEKYGGWFLYILFYGILMWEVRECDI